MIMKLIIIIFHSSYTLSFTDTKALLDLYILESFIIQMIRPGEAGSGNDASEQETQ